MKKAMKNIAVAIAVLSVCGCENHSQSESSAESELSFAVQGINGMSTRAGYDTPADITSADPGFGVYIAKDPADLLSSGNLADNHNIKWDGDSWYNSTTGTSGTKLEWPETGTVSAFAYCPFRGGITDVTAIPIQIQNDQSTLENLKASDFIRAKAFNCQKNETGTIPLTFYHQLSKLKFNLTWSSQAEIGTLTSLKVNADVLWQGEYNLVAGKVIASPMYVSNPKGYIYNQTPTSATAEVILMPQQISKGKFLKITTEKSGKEVYYILNLPENLILDANTQYNFNITLKPGVEESEATLDPSMSSIEKWGEVNKGDWDLSANVKKMNLLKAELSSSLNGLTLVVVPSLPLHDDSQVAIYIDGETYFGRYMGAGLDTTYCYMKKNNLGGKKYKLSIAARQSDHSLSAKGTTAEDDLMSYRIEPDDIYVPTSVHITPVYDKAAGTIVFTASQNVETDITYKVFQRKRQTNSEEYETISVDAIILKGTNKSQTIDINLWDKTKNALVTLITKSSDTNFGYCKIIRENVYYHLEGSFWGSDGETIYELHIVL